MRKTIFIMVLLFTSLSFTVQVGAQSKAIQKEAKKKAKEYKKKNWEITGSSRSLDSKLVKHFQKLDSEQYYEILGAVSMCRSLNVCAQNAQLNAIALYAGQANTKIEGEIKQTLENNASSLTPQELDEFLAEYKANIQAEIKSLLELSYAVVRTHADGKGKEYQAFYLIDRTAVRRARIKAMNSTGKNSKVRGKIPAKELEKMVKNDFEPAASQ